MNNFVYILILIVFSSTSCETFAEDWLPTDGPYAAPGKDHAERCLDFGDMTLDLKRMSRGEPDGFCKIRFLTRLSQYQIRLDMICSDVANEKHHRESALIERIDENSIFYRETERSAWKRSRSVSTYCGEGVRDVYENNLRRSKN